MARQGITGDAAEEIIRSITSFALYGFPESHAASFALLVYASAYLKAHYPAAFFTAMLNNQPMGFYHPATLVKDAQRHGVRFAPIDVQVSDWECRVEPDGRVRLGLMYVNGLREAVGRAIAAGPPSPVAAAPRDAVQVRRSSRSHPKRCPKCGCDDESMLEETPEQTLLQHLRARVGQSGAPAAHRAVGRPASGTGRRYRSIEALIAAPACAATSWRRSPRSARSMPSATIAAARCGRSSGPCARQGSCSRKTGIRDRDRGPGDRGVGTRDPGPGIRHTRSRRPARIRPLESPSISCT